jgi:hypothetical protein
LKKLFLAVAAALVAGSGSAQVPLFAARCPSGITADSNTKGQVYVNGKVAKLIKRPDGQITARSGGVYVDITPRGNEPPRVTSTARDKSVGECEILSFKAPDGGGTARSAGGAQRAPSSERAGQGQFDVRGPVPCSMSAGQPVQECRAAVARDPGGTATIVVTRPDGRTRAIFLAKGKAIGAALSQADGSQHFRATKSKDGIYKIEAGNERFEIVEAFVFGG